MTGSARLAGLQPLKLLFGRGLHCGFSVATAETSDSTSDVTESDLGSPGAIFPGDVELDPSSTL